MSEKIVQVNEEVIKELVRGSVEETLNELLERFYIFSKKKRPPKA